MSKNEQETRVSEPEMHSAANSRLSVLLHTDLKLLLYNVPKMLAQRQLSLKVPDLEGVSLELKIQHLHLLANVIDGWPQQPFPC